MKTILIEGDALFDILRGKEVADFRWNYKDVFLKVTDENVIYDGVDAFGEVNYDELYIHITKSAFMELLLNRVFSCEEYIIKLEL